MITFLKLNVDVFKTDTRMKKLIPYNFTIYTDATIQ